jgi:hypothetical protein
MVSTNVFCDRCKSQIMEQRSNYSATCGPARQTRESLDLCQDCLGILNSWLLAGPDGPSLEGSASATLEVR